MRACYDLAASPPTFDFVGFLVSAERERKIRGAPKLTVVIVRGPRGGFRDDNLPPYDIESRRAMLETIVKPMCQLLPSCDGVEECEAREAGKIDFPQGWTPTNRIPHYGLRRILDAFDAGCFPLGVKAELDPKLITITLRQTEYWPTRNSDEPAWTGVALRLQREGWRVEIIPDDLTVRVPIYLYRPDLMRDLVGRARLYASARMNLFVNNGPAWMTAFMPQAPGLIFKMVAKDAPCVSPEYFAGVGFPVGSQPGRAAFRMVWEDDAEETIYRECMREIEAPTKPKFRAISKETFDNTLNNDRQKMLAQVGENLKRELPWFGGGPVHQRAALIVGGGPSLADTLPKLRMRHQRGGKIFALNGVHDWLIERGLVPDYHVLLDSREENVRFVEQPHKDVHYLISAFCHPAVFEALKDYRVTLWMSDMEGMVELVRHREDKPVCLVGGGATVGCKTMFLAYLDGYRKEHFFGFDSCYRDGENHAYPQTMNAHEQKVEIVARAADGRERKFVCAPWMTKQAQQWQTQAKNLAKLGCEIWVHGDGLIPWIAQQLSVEQAA